MGYLSGMVGSNVEFLDTLIRYACGVGSLAAPAYSGVGDGTLNDLDAKAGAVTETWTISCTAAATNGGTFSVSGSVSGAQADATVGTPYDNGFLRFVINDGATDFQVGDQWTVDAAAGALAGSTDQWTALRWTRYEKVLASSITGTYEP